MSNLHFPPSDFFWAPNRVSLGPSCPSDEPDEAHPTEAPPSAASRLAAHPPHGAWVEVSLDAAGAQRGDAGRQMGTLDEVIRRKSILEDDLRMCFLEAVRGFKGKYIGA